MKKPTMKSRVLDFVESVNAARFTEIQEFIVDQKFGAGTYKAAAGTDTTWTSGPNGLKTRKCNPYRGYFSSAFNSGQDSRYWPKAKHSPGYFLLGPERLEKREDGLYQVVRKKA